MTDRYVLLAAVLLAGTLAVILLAPRPKVIILLWLAVICFVPLWLGVTISVYFPPAIISGAVVLLLILPINSVRVGWGDIFVLFFVMASLLPFLSGGSTRTTVFVMLAQWLLPFLIGRLAPLKVGLSWIYGCIAVLFTIVAILAVLEFGLRRNLFISIHASNDLYVDLSKLQTRGSIIRAEGAFGHSIALGASIALAIPFALASRFRLSIRTLMTAAMLAGTVVSFSRTAMICAGLSVVLSVLFLRDSLSPRSRTIVIAGFIVVGVAAIPFVSSIFAGAGSEATNSADYRGDLFSLVPDLAISGFSSVAHINPAGDLYFGRFHSIDSALILLGLTYGWLVLAIALGLLIAAVVLVVARRASPATIAIVAQIPALATVALITQYSTFFWFVAGLAVFSQTMRPAPVAAAEPLRQVGLDPGSPELSNSRVASR